MSINYKSAQNTRQGLQQRAESLGEHFPLIQQELMASIQEAMASGIALQLTPELQLVEQVGVTWGPRNGHIDNRLVQVPHYFLWYTLQDNTLYRQQLLLQLAAARMRSQQSMTTLYDNRAAIVEIAEQADVNFGEFYRLADLLGRRSLLEHEAARRLSQSWLESDPKHAGAMLIQAYGLRNGGRYDECQRILEQLDRNYPLMEAVRGTVAGQIAWVQDNRSAADKLLEQATAAARKASIAEPFLVRGWIAMADKKWSRAKQDATLAVKLAPNNWRDPSFWHWLTWRSA